MDPVRRWCYVANVENEQSDRKKKKNNSKVCGEKFLV